MNSDAFLLASALFPVSFAAMNLACAPFASFAAAASVGSARSAGLLLGLLIGGRRTR
ncbi:hypothetical protein GTW51_03060 [Aurantimonas aggregata]|uniref:Uncharacterized protein n=1 Tax=Aurantimonas aggregata TaxID=2047720 RepID=A0A6L9MCW8_9HYPH|nr:hypothetical protein [Aurantimonas aggregata]NDV85674.1 hypothetical protein [Aurantimonas aggregata]